ncbi:MAG TPA: sulfotransferase domain-containing protein [Kiritimatiellia bacterium]|nr:sulfotransferase domain-containing protein [Kiritimatiellia bacterium]
MIDFIVIGTHRGGTQSFYDYLLQHPHIVPALQPDSGFFDRNYSKGIEWYAHQFPLLSEYEAGQRPVGHITGENSSSYMYHPLVAERVKRHCPNAKFIVLLRNPTDRAYSHYRHSVRLGHETLKFRLALRMEPKRLERGTFLMRDNPYHVSLSHQMHSYVTHGFYARQLQVWFRHFGPSRFLILRSEDYFADPIAASVNAFAFLGLPEFTPQWMEPPYVNPYEVLTEETREKIDSIFKKSNEDLCRLLKWDRAWA